jgi:hypothetical protein
MRASFACALVAALQTADQKVFFSFLQETLPVPRVGLNNKGVGQ